MRSRIKERVTTDKKKKPAATPKTPRSTSKASSSAASKLAAREEQLKAARDELGLFKTPLTILSLFVSATAAFVGENAKALATSKVALLAVYPLALAYAATTTYMPELYTPPDCRGSAAGALYAPRLAVVESLWWLVLGILSSVGLGTGLHSGIMFLWPFCMLVILQAEACQSTNFVATYNQCVCLLPTPTMIA